MDGGEIDRALTTNLWLSMFSLAKLYNLKGSSLDHSPIMLVPEVSEKMVGQRKFKFENAWLTEPMCRQLVQEVWDSESNVDIQGKIKNYGEKLQQRGKEVTCGFGVRIKECKMEMKRLRKFKDPDLILKYKKAKEKLFLILEQEEIFWRQISKQFWLHSSDQNSKYFHATESTRRRNNQMHRLNNGEGVWVDWINGLAEHITEFYDHLFTATQSHWHEVIDCIEMKKTTPLNNDLLKQVTAEEVRVALFQMNPDKSPGPDGMTPAFYQKN